MGGARAASVRPRHLRILVVGNSIAEAKDHVRLKQTWSYRLVQAMDPGAVVSVRQVRLRSTATNGYRVRTSKVELLNVGVGGAWSKQVCRRLPTDMAGFDADVALVVTGTNDIAHRVPRPETHRLARKIDRILRTGGSDVFFANVPRFAWEEPDAMSATAERHNEWLAAWKGDRCVDIAGATLDAERLDGGHFGPDGNQRIADAFLAAFWRTDTW